MTSLLLTKACRAQSPDHYTQDQRERYEWRPPTPFASSTAHKDLARWHDQESRAQPRSARNQHKTPRADAKSGTRDSRFRRDQRRKILMLTRAPIEIPSPEFASNMAIKSTEINAALAVVRKTRLFIDAVHSYSSPYGQPSSARTALQSEHDRNHNASNVETYAPPNTDEPPHERQRAFTLRFTHSIIPFCSTLITTPSSNASYLVSREVRSQTRDPRSCLG
jgi:hypothetical protein